MKFAQMFVFSMAIFLTGCISEQLNINNDPNSPIVVPVSAQMPAIQLALVDVIGGQFSRINNLLIQQVEGVARSWASFNQYTALTPNRFDSSWNNCYENILNEIKIAKASSMTDGNNHTLGILNVMEAFILMQATDVWDEIPYTEALNGIDNINPKYNSQFEIYDVINNRLNEAISLFEGDQGPVNPEFGDVIFEGDISKWLKTAYAIRARGKLHFKDYSGAADDAAAYTSAEDNFSFQYPDENAAGQWYRFNRDRTGDLEFHPTMRNLMNATNDSNRLGLIDQTFTTSHPYLVARFNQELITYREMQFITAEADVRSTNGGTSVGHTAYLNGIKASFERFGLDQAAYDQYIGQNEVDPGVGNLTLDRVMEEKYVAMFLQPEAYSDWRRTGIPALIPVSGNAVPVRWDYPSNEYLFNENLTNGDINIYTNRVGWNQ